jgi:hypothetical protein
LLTLQPSLIATPGERGRKCVEWWGRGTHPDVEEGAGNTIGDDQNDPDRENGSAARVRPCPN